MPSPDSVPSLDLSQMPFPTDKVTIGAIRQRQPSLFINEDADIARFDVFATMSVERVLAKKAFAKAAGLPDPFPDDGSMSTYTRQEAVWMLNSDYQRYGISTGLHQTRELVKDFEKAAADQARSQTP